MLEPLPDLALEASLGDRPRQEQVERCLPLAIECMLGVADHLIAEHAWRRAAGGAEALEILGEAAVLPAASRARSRGLAGFRHVLAHACLRLVPRRVHAYLRRLDDLRRFGRHVQAFLDRPPPA
jgi:uncharacterized protein YutE (UPF0331/DUF86 family)